MSFAHWWAEWGKPTLAENRSLVLDRCAAWRRNEMASCDCRLMAEELHPPLTLPGRARVSEIPPSPSRIAEVSSPSPRLILQQGHAEQPVIAILAPNGPRSAHQNGRRIWGSHNPQPVAAGGFVLSVAAGDIVIWDAETGLEVRRIRNTSRIVSLAVSGNGEWVLGSDEAHRARLWHTATGRVLRTFENVGYGIAFSPDGRSAAMSGSGDNVGAVYDLNTGRRTLDLDHGEFSYAEFSRDGSLVLTYDHSDTLTLWNLRAGTLMFRRNVADLEGALFSTDGSSVIAYGGRGSAGRVQVVGLDGALLPAISFPTKVWSVTRTPDAHHVLVRTRRAEIWDLVTGTALFGVTDPDEASDHQRNLPLNLRGGIADAAVLPDASKLVVLGSEGTVSVWSLDTDREVARHTDESLRGAYHLDLSNDGRHVLFSGAQQELQLFQLDPLRPGPTLGRNPRLMALSHARFLSNGLLLLGSDDVFTIWDLDDLGREKYRFQTTVESVSASSLAFDAGHRLISLETGRALPWFVSGDSFASVGISPDGRVVAALSLDGRARLLDVESGRQISETGAALRTAVGSWLPTRLVISRDNNLVALAGGSQVEIWNSATGSTLAIPASEGGADLASIAFSPSGERILLGDENGVARILDTRSGHELARFVLRLQTSRGDRIVQGEFITEDRVFLRSSSGLAGDYAIGGAGPIRPDHDLEMQMAFVAAGNISATLGVSIGRILSFAVSPSGTALATGGVDGTARIWDVRTGRRLALLNNEAPVVALAFAPDGRRFVTVGDNGAARLWELGSGEPRFLASLVSYRDGQWAVFSQTGGFDTDDVEQLVGLNWVLPDQPFRPLAPEIFMRDYYQPRLLARLMNDGNSPPVAPLVTLNRSQPAVRIVSISRGASPEMALVDVEVSGADRAGGIYDLRLYRDGQLVGQWPENNGGGELHEWRRQTHIPMADGQPILRHRFAVRLAAGRRGQAVSFTAYAFNEDRVKSATARDDSYRVPDDIGAARPRAYVVAVGVNDYGDPDRDLYFAVRDAEGIVNSLRRVEGYEVIPVLLASDRDRRRPSNATKARLGDVLARLGGRPVSGDALAHIPNAARLRPATPDDLVVIAFSGHGDIDSEGDFYLLPSTSPGGAWADAEGHISSEELGEWLRPIDAGVLAMIIDACHSAASVDRPGFRPGPMGDRGLGQLVYDKGIRLLASTQPDDLAIESEGLQQGLLTYALREGLMPGSDGFARADANRDARVSLTEWLAYGAERTPSIYEDFRAGLLRPLFIGRGSSADGNSGRNLGRRVQTPAFFNFTRGRGDVIIARSAGNH